MKPTHLDLFSGIGGISLAAEAVGFQTLAFVEVNPSCKSVLNKRWPEVPVYGDIRDAGRDLESYASRVDLLSGGFPCQPTSLAGKRLGTTDSRYLWPQMAETIRKIKPTWVLGENVPGLFTSNKGQTFGDILRDLAQMGYRVGWCCFGANRVGAPHIRRRIFIIAFLPNQVLVHPTGP